MVFSKLLRSACCACLLLAGSALSLDAQKAPAAPLKIYFIDTEGGQATLFILPDKTSFLVDTGFSRPDARDANRIVAAAKDAGVTKIDYLLLTHFHVDHIAGLSDLINLMPIGTIFDHGESHEVEPPSPNTPAYKNYLKLIADRNIKPVILHAGDKLPVPGLPATIVSADGKIIDKAIPGGGQKNDACAVPDHYPDGVDTPDSIENHYSIGFVATWGKIRFNDFGDLTWEKERELMCPVNKIGHLNLFIVSHHMSKPSNGVALINGIAPQVTIGDNGERKGGYPGVLDRLRDAPSHPDRWQLHTSLEGNDSENSAPDMTANLLSAAGEAARKAIAEGKPAGRPQGQQTNDEGYMIIAELYQNGTFKVTNSRNGFSKTYKAN
jgi:competence protein ComEC